MVAGPEEELHKPLGYFEDNAHGVRYKVVPLPGHVRRLRRCRGQVQGVGRRLKLSGVHWSVRGATGILALREEASGRWLPSNSRTARRQALTSPPRQVDLDTYKPVSRPTLLHPPRKCRWCSLVCSYAPVPVAPHARPRNGAAGPVPAGVKSYRVTMDRAGRWHVAFAAIPEPVPA